MRVLLGRLLLPLRSARLCLRRLILIFLPLYLSRLVRRPYIFRLALEDSVFLTKVFPFLRIRFWLQAVLRALLRWLILHGRVPLMVALRHLCLLPFLMWAVLGPAWPLSFSLGPAASASACALQGFETVAVDVKDAVGHQVLHEA